MDQARDSHSNQGFVSKRYKKRLIMECIYQIPFLINFNCKAFWNGLTHNLSCFIPLGYVELKKYDIPICAHIHPREPIHSNGNYENKGTSMTLALGACCDDGVVIVEDKVIYKPLTMEKDKISYAEKLRGVILNIIFGYSGEVKMYDLFVRYLVGDVVILRDEQEAYTTQNMI
jgi:hypothetical protein